MSEEGHSGPQGLDGWLDRIGDQELPIFGHTANEIRELTLGEQTGVADLARAILRDPGMTAKLLRIANSVIFNTSGNQVTTVSRAIVLLGFDMVRQIALSVAFIDAFLRGSPRQRVQGEVARAIHAAVQARWLALQRHDGQSEEVFIAALLYRFGHLAFWCVATDAGDVLEEALRGDPLHPQAVEQAVLGFRLKQLTLALVREWHISPLLLEALNNHPTRHSREQAVVLAYRLAEAAAGGWSAPAARSSLEAIAGYVHLPQEAIEDAALKNAAEAARVAECYGASKAARLIPQ